MRNDAVALLEPLFGVGAEKKVDEFARKSPPHQYPLDFLGKCKQHAAMMVGMRKGRGNCSSRSTTGCRTTEARTVCRGGAGGAVAAL
jgi:hypothetical protein